jgi:hypothetical protein
MTPINQILHAGRGVAFVPIVFGLSTRVAGVLQNEFDTSSGRAISLIQTSKALNLDGVVNDASPLASYEASGKLGKSELRETDIRNMGAPKLSIETTAKLSQSLKIEDKDVLGVMFGTGYLEEAFQSHCSDAVLCVDNLANLERMYIEAGCTCILLFEKKANQNPPANYSTIANIGLASRTPTAILYLEETGDSIMTQAQETGFSLAGDFRLRAKSAYGSVVAINFEGVTEAQVADAIGEMGCAVLLTTAYELPIDFSPERLLRLKAQFNP